MARNGNFVETQSLRIAVPKPVVALLEELSKTGYLGKNPSESASLLMMRGLEAWQGGKALERAVNQALDSLAADGQTQ